MCRAAVSSSLAPVSCTDTCTAEQYVRAEVRLEQSKARVPLPGSGHGRDEHATRHRLLGPREPSLTLQLQQTSEKWLCLPLKLCTGEFSALLSLSPRLAHTTVIYLFILAFTGKDIK